MVARLARQSFERIRAVPPAQCPECARFLSKAFVASLDDGEQPCPKCETLLGASQFGGEPEADTTTAPAVADEESDAAEPVAETSTAPDRTSVRPPDLEPAAVRADAGGRPPLEGTPEDPLGGWQTGGNVVDLDDFRRSAGPFDSPVVVTAAAAAAGALLGSLVSRRRGLGAVVGAVTAAGAAQAATQLRNRA